MSFTLGSSILEPRSPRGVAGCMQEQSILVEIATALAVALLKSILNLAKEGAID